MPPILYVFLKLRKLFIVYIVEKEVIGSINLVKTSSNLVWSDGFEDEIKNRFTDSVRRYIFTCIGR